MEKQETFHKIMEEWAAQSQIEGIRAGQGLSNAVQIHDVAVARHLTWYIGLDPYHNDSLIPSAISWLAERYFG